MAQERILVIDGRTETHQLLVELVLEPKGYRSLTAMDGEEGLRLALKEKPDLILLDMQLGRMGGIEVLKALREWNLDVPVLQTRDQPSR